MLKQSLFLSIFLLFSFASLSPTFAGSREILFHQSSGEEEAKVEMDSTQFQKKLIPGETIIQTKLWMYYRVSNTVANSVGNYEIYCTARKVYRSELAMSVQDEQGTETHVKVPQSKLLEGKDYQDFIGIMNLLCTR